MKSRDSGMSSMDGESNSDAEDQSHEEPGEAGHKKRLRKIPKLPMVRHGKKWYRARLLRDSGQRVHIGAALSSSFPPLQYNSALDVGCLLQALLSRWPTSQCSVLHLPQALCSALASGLRPVFWGCRVHRV